MKRLVRALAILAAVVLALAYGIRFFFGGGMRLEDRTGDPLLPGSALEKVVDLEYPPGNIAVAPSGRIFFTLHPDGNPPSKVHELVDGQPVPFPSAEFQQAAEGAPHFDTILSLRVDRLNRLWVLDFAGFGRGQPRLLAFDIDSRELVHRHDFPSSVAGLLSMLNDFQVDARGETVYIAETSPIRQTPALIVYDVVKKESRRVLHAHPSVRAEDYVIQAPGRDMRAYGLVTLRIGVDSIALDRDGEWLYYGPVNGGRLYRIATEHLKNAALDEAALGAEVEDYAAKTLSDGLTTDSEGNVYLSDMEHSAVVRVGQDRKLTTLVKDPRLRWPDGFSFGPGGWLYVTCSALQHVLFVSESERKAHAPYQIFRLRPAAEGFPGH
jgi:sugar lactone lactonase YvrE